VIGKGTTAAAHAFKKSGAGKKKTEYKIMSRGRRKDEKMHRQNWGDRSGLVPDKTGGDNKNKRRKVPKRWETARDGKIRRIRFLRFLVQQFLSRDCKITHKIKRKGGEKTEVRMTSPEQRARRNNGTKTGLHHSKVIGNCSIEGKRKLKYAAGEKVDSKAIKESTRQEPNTSP